MTIAERNRLTLDINADLDRQISELVEQRNVAAHARDDAEVERLRIQIIWVNAQRIRGC